MTQCFTVWLRLIILIFCTLNSKYISFWLKTFLKGNIRSIISILNKNVSDSWLINDLVQLLNAYQNTCN